jgi:hypothetical protein
VEVEPPPGDVLAPGEISSLYHQGLYFGIGQMVSTSEASQAGPYYDHLHLLRFGHRSLPNLFGI